MIRVATVADSHFDETSRFEDCVRIHDWIADEIQRRRVNLLLHSGDVFERKSTPRERAAFARWLRAVADHCPVVIVRGNHDAVEDLSIFAKLRTRFPVIVEEAAGVHVVESNNGVSVAVGCLAWPRKAELLAASGTHGQAGQQLAQAALQDILRGLGAELRDHRDGPRILLAHALVTGSKTSTGQPLVGHDMELDLSELALAPAELYALGHIHLHQAWTIDRNPVVFPGSPRRTSFGETEEKGFLIADLDDAAGQGLEGCEGWHCIDCDLVPTPATPMLFGEDDWGVDAEGKPGWLVGWHGLDSDQAAGAEVRLRYQVDADQRDAARAAAGKVRDDLLERGAIHVKIEEEVRAAQRARAPEVARAVTLANKLDAFWTSRNTVPEHDRRARLLQKLERIESEVRNAA